MDSFLEQIYQTFKLGLLFHTAIGFNGMLRAGVRVQGLRNRKIIRMDEKRAKIDEYIVENDLEDEFSLNSDVSTREFGEKLDSIILEIYKQFLFACGLGKDRNALDNLSGKHYNLVKNRYKT